MLWANYTHEAKKVKGHFLFDLMGLPDKLVLTDGNGSEREALRQNLKAGITYLMDRGYNDYKLFHTVKEAQAHFVTRWLKSAAYSLIQEVAVQPDQQQLGVVSDQWIRFDHSDPVMWVRKVEWRNANGTLFTYLTRRADIEPYLVVRLYQSRW